MRRYLVTGAQGFAGRYLVAEILRRDETARVVGVGRSPRSDEMFTHSVKVSDRSVAAPLPDTLPAPDSERYRYVECDLAEGAAATAVLQEYRPNTVFHLAAALRDDPHERLVRGNVEGTLSLVRAAGTLAEPPLTILGSSGSIYGRTPTPYQENAAYAPLDPYARSKLAAELIGKLAAEAAGVPLIIARIFNIVGAGMDERHVCARFVQQAVAIASGFSDPTIEVGNLLPGRDFIDVSDVACALLSLSERGAIGQAYNIASGIETTIADILTIVLHESGLDGRVTIRENYVRHDDLMHQQADVSRLNEIGFRRTYSIAESLRAVVAYYRDDVVRALGSES